jgi:MFS family permease
MTDTTPDTTAATRPLWQKDFRWYWGGYSASRIGDFTAEIALPLATFAQTHSAVAVGVVAAMAPVATIVFALPAGAIADRLVHRRVLLVTDAARVAILAITAGLLAVGACGFVGLALAALALGTASILHDAAEVPALTVVVPSAGLVAANGRIGASDAAANVTGPPLGGALVGAGGPALAFLVDAITFVMSFVATLQVTALERHGRARLPTGAVGNVGNVGDRPARFRGADLQAGFRELVANKVVWRAALIVAAANVAAVGVDAQFIPFARSTLHLSGLAIGGLFSLAGVVGLLTSLLVAQAGRVRPDFIVIGVAVFAVGVLAAGVFPSLATAIAAFVACGVGSGSATCHWGALRQQQFPTEMLGRVTMASRIVLTVGMALALVGGGFVSRAAGPPTLFIVLGLVGLGSVVLFGPSLLRARVEIQPRS